MKVQVDIKLPLNARHTELKGSTLLFGIYTVLFNFSSSVDKEDRPVWFSFFKLTAEQTHI